VYPINPRQLHTVTVADVLKISFPTTIKPDLEQFYNRTKQPSGNNGTAPAANGTTNHRSDNHAKELEKPKEKGILSFLPKKKYSFN
jgi:hypothetical protein